MPDKKPYKSITALVQHRGVGKDGEKLLLLRYDPRLCAKHAVMLAGMLRRLRREIPDVLRRARKMDMALQGWGNNSSAEVTHWIYGSGKGRIELSGEMRLSLSRHNPSSFTVTVGDLLGEQEVMLSLRLLDFMENLHLEGRDAALIARLMKERVAWAAKQIQKKERA